MEKLKPCPFCGGDGEIRKEKAGVFGLLYEVVCKKCLASTAIEITSARAIERWNRGVNDG